MKYIEKRHSREDKILPAMYEYNFKTVKSPAYNFRGDSLFCASQDIEKQRHKIASFLS